MTAIVMGCLGCGTSPSTATPEIFSEACSMLPWGRAETILEAPGSTAGVETNGHGRVRLTLRSPAGCSAGSPTGRIDFSVELVAISGVMAVHIHGAEDVRTQPARVVLFEGFRTTTLSGRFVEGSFTDADVKGMSLKELESLLCKGSTYVDVHTTAYPQGEVRGTIVGDGMRCRPTVR